MVQGQEIRGSGTKQCSISLDQSKWLPTSSRTSYGRTSMVKSRSERDMNSKSDDSSVPAPTSARLELPNVEAMRALGLGMGLEEARLVLTCLSGVIATGTSKSR